MIITYYGKAFTRLQFGDMVVAINPIGKDAEAKSSRFGADIALVSLNDPSFNGVDNLSAGSKEPFVIGGPGEYELSDVFIKGYPSEGPDGKINTIYTVLLEGMKVCHLGVLAKNDLDPNIVEVISGADVLFVPVGDGDTLEPKVSAKLANSLIPKMIIPVLYGEKDSSPAIKEFVKEVGGGDNKPVDKLSLKRKDLDGKEGEVVILTTV